MRNREEPDTSCATEALTKAFADADGLFRTMFEHAAIAISLVDPAGHFIAVNPAYQRMMGYTAAELRGQHYTTLCHTDDLAASSERNARMDGGEIGTFTHERRFVTKAGETRWGRLSVVRIDDGSPIQAFKLSTVEDITERKRAEEALKESERRFRAVVEGAAVGIQISDLAGNSLSTNRTLRTMLGYNAHELNVLHFSEYTYPEDRAPNLALRNKLIAGQIDHYQLEKRYVRKDGSIFWGRLTVSRISDGHAPDQPFCVAMVEDFNEKKRAEEALRGSEQQLRAVFDSAALGIRIANVEGRCLSTNRALQRMLGYSAEEFLGMHFRAFTHPDDHDRSDAAHAAVIDGPDDHVRIEKRYVRKDGAIFWGRLTMSRISDSRAADRPYYIAIVENVNEERRAQQALRESERQFRAVVEGAAIGMRVADVEGRTIVVNQALCDLLGFDADEFASCHFSRFTHPDDLERDNALFRSLTTGERDHYQIEKRYLRKDGTIFWGRLTASRIGDDPKPGHPYYVAMVEDFTERRRYEEAITSAKEQAEAANRAKSDFLAQMSHELRTPLNAIIGFTDVMQKELFGRIDNPRYRDYLHDIVNAARHLHEVIGNILDLSKIEAGKHELYESAFDVAASIRACARIIEGQALAAGVTIEARIDAEPVLFGDAGTVRQILINLLSNALKFTPAGGRVTIEAGIDRAGALRIAVRDTGIGMDPDEIPRALEMFGQVDRGDKRRYGGTGLGLPLSKALVELHGGRMDIQSTRGKGTTVAITFPQTRVRDPADIAAAD